MGICASKPASEAEEVVVPTTEPALTVAIVGARGLRGVEWFPGTERFFFCTLRAAGQEGELHKTKLVKDTVAPFWKEEAAVSAYSPGDALEFAVWDADADGQGDMLGQAVLEPEKFAEQGFHGEVQLTVGGEPKPSFLMIKVKVEGKNFPEGPLKEFSVPIENPKKKSIGLDLDGQDGTTQYVLAVKAGPIQVYNKEAEPARQVLPGDFVVKANDAEGSAAKILETLKKATQLELTIRRPMEFDVAVKSEDGKQPHGVEFVKKPTGSALAIASVGPGPVKAWNEDNPDQEVCAGDRIVAVNGKKGKAADLQKRMKAARFHMTVARPAPPEPETASGKADEAGEAGEAQQEEGQEATKTDGNGEE